MINQFQLSHMWSIIFSLMSEASPKVAHIQLGLQLDQFMSWVFSFIAPISSSSWLKRMPVVSQFSVTQEKSGWKSLLITRISHSTPSHSHLCGTKWKRWNPLNLRFLFNQTRELIITKYNKDKWQQHIQYNALSSGYLLAKHWQFFFVSGICLTVFWDEEDPTEILWDWLLM